MSDVWDEFLAPSPAAEPGSVSRRRRTSAANPRSTVATDPYVDLEAEGEPAFKVTDPTSSVFGYPEQFYIVEVTYSVREDVIYGFGYRVLRDGGIAAKKSSEAIAINSSDLPDYVLDRIQP